MKYYASIKVGLVFSILTILLGVTVGSTVHTPNSWLHDLLTDSGFSVVRSVYAGDIPRLQETVSQALSLIVTAHLFSAAMGGTSLAMILLLIIVSRSKTEIMIASMLLGVSGLLFGLSGVVIGFTAPSIGSVELARGMYQWLSFLGIGAFVIGALWCLKSVLRYDSLSHNDGANTA
jgi:hypothetical protein